MPNPKLNIFIPSFAPLVTCDREKTLFNDERLLRLSDELKSGRNNLASIVESKSALLSSLSVFRGSRFDHREAENMMSSCGGHKTRNVVMTVRKSSSCFRSSASMLSNSSHAANILSGLISTNNYDEDDKDATEIIKNVIEDYAYHHHLSEYNKSGNHQSYSS